MFRSRYDDDPTTFNPEGRILQVENAEKSVTQGMPTVAICSKTHAVVACIMHSPSQFSSYQEKIFKIDEHIGIAFSGLTADGRSLCKILRNEALQHQFVYGSEISVSQSTNIVAERSQKKTMSYGKRPYGVGLFIIGVDKDGPHLYETSPSGDAWEFNAQAIGRKAQAAKTYLEHHIQEFPDCSRDELISHSIKSLHDSRSQSDEGLQCLAVGIVGQDEPFTILRGDELQPYASDI